MLICQNRKISFSRTRRYSFQSSTGFTKVRVCKINWSKGKHRDVGVSSKSPSNNLSLIQILVREELSMKDIDMKDVTANERIIKSKRITDSKRHSNVPPKPMNKITEGVAKKAKSKPRPPKKCMTFWCHYFILFIVSEKPEDHLNIASKLIQEIRFVKRSKKAPQK